VSGFIIGSGWAGDCLGMKRYLLLALMTAPLAACSTSNDGNMIGAPWQWPGAIVSGAVGNAIYDARRNRVKTHVSGNFDAISTEARAGGGPMMAEAARLAEVPQTRRAQLFAQMRDSHGVYFDKPTREEAIEAVTIAFMVYGGP
jgi:hypothetical protein